MSGFLASSFSAVVVWLLVKEISAFDQDVFNRLMLAFHSDPSKPLSGILVPSPAARPMVSAIFAVFSFSIFGMVANVSGFKFPPFVRVVICVNLFAVSLLYQSLFYTCFTLTGYPVGYALSLLFGFATGGWLRQLNEAHKLSQTHYYELKIRNAELNTNRLIVVKQNEVERRMLAADLHDQVLNDMKQLVQRFESYVEKEEEEDLQRVRALSAKIMHEIREVMESLCPSVLEHLGLVAALEDCLRKGAERSNFKVRFRSKIDQDDLQGLSLVEQSLLYRLVQESITNICKHAEASTVRIVVEKSENFLVIQINDDGKGIDPAKSRQDSRGLKYMRLRADLIGATIAWKGGDNNRGTKVEIRMDLSEKTTVGTDDH